MSSNTRIQRKPVGNTRNVRYNPVDRNLDHVNNNDRHQVNTSSTFPPANQIPALVNDGPEQEIIELVDRAFDQSGMSVPSPQVQSPIHSQPRPHTGSWARKIGDDKMS
jgi:hypothetical protein